MDTEMVQPKKDHDIDLMLKATEVTPWASPSPAVDQVPGEQGETIFLEDDLGTYVYNIAFDESWHKVVQAHRVHTSDDHTSPVHFEEWVIMSDVWIHPTILDDAMKAYVEATRSRMNFLIVEHEHMAKDLQAAK